MQEGIQCLELTADGFHFVLLDMPTQVHIILRKYIEFTIENLAEKTRHNQQNYLLKLIFNLALSEFSKVYKLRSADLEGEDTL